MPTTRTSPRRACSERCIYYVKFAESHSFHVPAFRLVLSGSASVCGCWGSDAARLATVSSYPQWSGSTLGGPGSVDAFALRSRVNASQNQWHRWIDRHAIDTTWQHAT